MSSNTNSEALSEQDQLLIDVAQQLQLTNTEYKNNVFRYEALANFIDADGSVLKDQVLGIYPSGSMAIGAAIRGQIKRDVPDVDVVLVLDIAADSSPIDVLTLVKEAITRGGDDDTYRNCKVEVNSRCVTVEYADGSTVDLMPVVVIKDDPTIPIWQLFHYKNDVTPIESYYKKISPIGFKNAVKKAIEEEGGSILFERVSRAMQDRYTVLAEKAEVEEFPKNDDFEEKSPRIIVLQLLKRFRDLRFRRADRNGKRKPPSIVLAALAIEAPFGRCHSFTDELRSVTESIVTELSSQINQPIEVRNPSYWEDVFTDRWPETDSYDQELWCNDLKKLLAELNKLKSERRPLEQIKILESLFGEEIAKTAVAAFAQRTEQARKSGKLAVAASGQAVISSTVSRFSSASSGRFGGDTH
ncbi:SMODS domain-containing nucleotidyltransferase [Hirschia baltica]|uniref:Nucleotidyltransferase n=1 Tax=Hirschia baltica (strain ATCC 49814 / DSM 5838 / IFAM 1418) TaxID=582402 RepID=C6XK73_HIRBI|nr:hypothetical protein [Hirschia baltica]ACT59518.1 conserved hypothetical protein [Hirschia baltica ATCC 49814]